jgi:hypothetical protein
VAHYDHTVRTTVTLDQDVLLLLRRAMKERGLSFKAALNEAIRAGMEKPRAPGKTYRFPRTFHMGFRPEIAQDKALSLAATLEEQEIARKLSLRK